MANDHPGDDVREEAKAQGLTDIIPADPWIITNARGEFLAVCPKHGIAKSSIIISHSGQEGEVIFEAKTGSHTIAMAPDGSEYHIKCVAMLHRPDHL